jgi:hypothetical protein
MKQLKNVLTLSLILFSSLVYGQLSVTLVPSNFHGSAVSCHGSSDATLSAVPTGGTEPYTYEWSNSATTSNLDGLAAGAYTVTVTDAESNTRVESIELLEPNVLGVGLNGTNVTIHGTHTGSITSNVSGGTTPYVYSWSTSATMANVSNLYAGSYTVTVSDMNGCSIISSVSLTEPDTLLASISVWRNPSCYKFRDGALIASATGGIQPYTYQWSNRTNNDTLDSIPAGAYTVAVYDANGALATEEVNLTQPERMNIKVATSLYNLSTTSGCYNQETNSSEDQLSATSARSVGGNVSCFGCTDGWISLHASGGTGNYIYQWAMTLVPLGSMKDIWSKIEDEDYIDAELTWVIDSDSLANLQPAIYWIRVTDEHNCVARDLTFIMPQECDNWSVAGNVGTNPQFQFMGTLDEKDLVIKTNNEERIRVKSDGQLNIAGNANFSSGLSIGGSALNIPEGYSLAVHGQMITEEVVVKLQPWPDYVFTKGYELRSINELKKFIATNQHLPGVPSSSEIESSKIGVGKLMSKEMEKIEELTLYMIQLKQEIDDLKVENEKLKVQVEQK